MHLNSENKKRVSNFVTEHDYSEGENTARRNESCGSQTTPTVQTRAFPSRAATQSVRRRVVKRQSNVSGGQESSTTSNNDYKLRPTSELGAVRLDSNGEEILTNASIYGEGGITAIGNAGAADYHTAVIDCKDSLVVISAL